MIKEPNRVASSDAGSPRVAEEERWWCRDCSTWQCPMVSHSTFMVPAELIAAVRAESAQERERLTKERDEYRTLSNVGVWHKDCRPNREMAARELEKSQAIIDKLAETITGLNAELEDLASSPAQETPDATE